MRLNRGYLSLRTVYLMLSCSHALATQFSSQTLFPYFAKRSKNRTIFAEQKGEKNNVTLGPLTSRSQCLMLPSSHASPVGRTVVGGSESRTEGTARGFGGAHVIQRDISACPPFWGVRRIRALGESPFLPRGPATRRLLLCASARRIATGILLPVLYSRTPRPADTNPRVEYRGNGVQRNASNSFIINRGGGHP
jgi:hypothetical protein